MGTNAYTRTASTAIDLSVRNNTEALLESDMAVNKIGAANDTHRLVVKHSDGTTVRVPVITGTRLNTEAIVGPAADPNTQITFADDAITLTAGGVDAVEIVEGATDYVNIPIELRAADLAAGGIVKAAAGSGAFELATADVDFIGPDTNSLSNYVPYTGATADVNLGDNKLGIGGDPTQTIHVVRSVAAGSNVFVDNPSAEDGAYAGVFLQNNSDKIIALSSFSSGCTSTDAGITVSDLGRLYSNNTTGLLINVGSNAPLYLATNDIVRQKIGTDGYTELARSLRIGSIGGADPGDNNVAIEGNATINGTEYINQTPGSVDASINPLELIYSQDTGGVSSGADIGVLFKASQSTGVYATLGRVLCEGQEVYGANPAIELQYGTTKAIRSDATGSEIATNMKIINVDGYTGLAIKVTLDTNGCSKGNILRWLQGSDETASKSASNEDMPIGIAAADIAGGASGWCIVTGYAWVLFKSGVTGTAGYVAYCSDTAGVADNASVVPAATTHFREIGHVAKAGASGGLALCVIHFN